MTIKTKKTIPENNHVDTSDTGSSSGIPNKVLIKSFIRFICVGRER